MKIVSILFGVGAMTSLFFAYQQQERKKLLFGKLGADVCWALHYFFLGAYTGMIPNFVGIFRELVFLRRGVSRRANHILWPVFFIAVSWGLGIPTLRTATDVLPLVASGAVTLSLWCKKPKLTKAISVPVSLAFLVYDLTVGSFIGVINESVAIFSIGLSFWKTKFRQGETTMQQNTIFTENVPCDKEAIIVPNGEIEHPAKILDTNAPRGCVEKGSRFADEIEANHITDFEKPGDRMVHVSTFLVQDETIYMTYYANTKEPSENPENQTARFAYCRMDNPENKVFFDIQSAGDVCGGKVIDRVYDTVMMQKDPETIFLLWTARAEENYYRFYRTFSVRDGKFSEVHVNRFRVGNVTNDFSILGVQGALAANGIGYKKMYADIGIMQKLSAREENGETFYYTGAYSGDFTCIIKSKDLITWEYVAQPDFQNDSKWENATYVWGDKCFYFVRQHDRSPYGFLTAYDLNAKTWAPPVLIGDCQSRGDFIAYRGELYLFHAPIDRAHIGIVRVDRSNLADSQILLQANMHTGCFYPFVQYFVNGELAMSYTVDRKHIRLARFTPENYLN